MIGSFHVPNLMIAEVGPAAGDGPTGRTRQADATGPMRIDRG